MQPWWRHLTPVLLKKLLVCFLQSPLSLIQRESLNKQINSRTSFGSSPDLGSLALRTFIRNSHFLEYWVQSILVFRLGQFLKSIPSLSLDILESGIYSLFSPVLETLLVFFHSIYLCNRLDITFSGKLSLAFWGLNKHLYSSHHLTFHIRVTELLIVHPSRLDTPQEK